MTNIRMLRRNYYFMRHGHSVAIAEGFIASRLLSDQPDPPLTPLGFAEAAYQSEIFRASHNFESFDIISSPFRRATETASILSGTLKTSYKVDDRIRERDFGDFDRTSSDNYRLAWDNDIKGLPSSQFNVESVYDIIVRVKGLIDDLEMSDSQNVVVLCSHGDVAAVTLTYYAGIDLTEYRTFGGMKTGQIRRIAQLPSE